ncbi:MAG: hypothetical protein JST86_01930 [Bacteroidetes bacterium]|nr:hypothetical protein [Bacteroidota bacterium]
MDNNDHTEQWVNGALNSLDGAGRATPKPFLYTRLKARMQNEREGSWDHVLRFISRPAVALAGLALILAINTLVVTYHYPTAKAMGTTDENTNTYASVDEYSSSAAVLNDIENKIEP